MKKRKHDGLKKTKRTNKRSKRNEIESEWLLITGQSIQDELHKSIIITKVWPIGFGTGNSRLCYMMKGTRMSGCQWKADEQVETNFRREDEAGARAKVANQIRRRTIWRNLEVSGWWNAKRGKLGYCSPSKSNSSRLLMCMKMIQYIRLKQTKQTGNTTRLYLSMSDGLTPNKLFRFFGGELCRGRRCAGVSIPDRPEVTFIVPTCLPLSPMTAPAAPPPLPDPVPPEVPPPVMANAFDPTISIRISCSRWTNRLPAIVLVLSSWAVPTLPDAPPVVVVADPPPTLLRIVA